jgi:hypothetical protein
MDKRTVQAEMAGARQSELRRRRAKRGVVAGYIHEISARHRAPEPRPIVAAAATAS